MQIPPLVRLSALLNASLHITADGGSDEDLKLLLAPGSSLGGARPKASVLDKDGALSVAKFPQHGDLIPTIDWESVALALAGKAGNSGAGVADGKSPAIATFCCCGVSTAREPTHSLSLGDEHA